MMNDDKDYDKDPAPMKSPYEKGSTDQDVVNIITSCRNEARTARLDRMAQNDLNYDFYHLRQNTGHKKQGQSNEFLPKQAMAVEQVTSFLHQGLVDFGDWFSVEASRGNKHPLLTNSEARALMKKFLDDANFYTYIQDAIKSGLTGSVMIAKVGSKDACKPRYVAKRKKAVLGYERVLEKIDEYEKQLDLSLVRPRDWYPDPTGRGVYSIERIEMDFFELKDIAERNPEIYDLEMIERLGVALCAGPDSDEQSRSRETGQNPTQHNSRMRVQLHEFWGTMVNERGEVLHRNCVSTMAAGTYLVRKPAPNPYWHQRSPYISAPIIRVPWSVWHKCLMDAPTMLNRAENELFNLILDSGLSSVFGVKQVRTNLLLNPEKLSGGIAPNEVIEVGPQCPPGVKAVETVSTGSMSQEALSALHVVSSEFSSASLTNDLRMGVLPSRSVKATEVVEASNSITGVFSSIAKAIEMDFVQPILELSFLTQMQNIEKFGVPEYEAILGEERSAQLDRASPEKRFSLTVLGHKFKVFGLTQTLNKMKDFRKLTTLMQTIAGVPVLMDQFMRKYDPVKLLGAVMKSLDIDEDQIKLDEVDEAMGHMGAQPDAGMQQGSGPDMMSQVPQMGASAPEAAAMGSTDRSQMPQGGGGPLG